MPRYYFDVKNGRRLPDSTGLDCSDYQDAEAKARIIARQIARDAPAAAQPRHIAVLDEDRNEISTVPVSE
jgi:hypothetical protein